MGMLYARRAKEVSKDLLSVSQMAILGGQATFNEANLEIYAFVLEDGRTTQSQMFDSLVSIGDINTGEILKYVCQKGVVNGPLTMGDGVELL